MNNQRIVSDLNIIKPPKWNNVILSAVTGNPVPYFYKKSRRSHTSLNCQRTACNGFY